MYELRRDQIFAIMQAAETLWSITGRFLGMTPEMAFEDFKKHVGLIRGNKSDECAMSDADMLLVMRRACKRYIEAFDASEAERRQS